MMLIMVQRCASPRHRLSWDDDGNNRQGNAQGNNATMRRPQRDTGGSRSHTSTAASTLDQSQNANDNAAGGEQGGTVTTKPMFLRNFKPTTGCTDTNASDFTYRAMFRGADARGNHRGGDLFRVFSHLLLVVLLFSVVPAAQLVCVLHTSQFCTDQLYRTARSIVFDFRLFLGSEPLGHVRPTLIKFDPYRPTFYNLLLPFVPDRISNKCIKSRCIPIICHL
jgi:hypothetical protein